MPIFPVNEDDKRFRIDRKVTQRAELTRNSKGYLVILNKKIMLSTMPIIIVFSYL